MTLKSDIRQSIKEFTLIEQEAFDNYSWLPYFISKKLDDNKLMHFPQIGEWDYEHECESTRLFEPLDFENCAILQISENQMVFCAGGDWQQPMTVCLIFDPVTEVYNCKVVSREYNEGMSNEEILQSLGLDYDQDGNVIFLTNSENTDDKKLDVPKQPITADICKAYIIQYYYNLKVPSASPLRDAKNWKRVSKRGTGIIYREFSNTIMGTRVLIEATDTKIISLTEL